MEIKGHTVRFARGLCTVAALVAAATGNFGLMSAAMGQPAALTKQQSDALDSYNNAGKAV